jgi:ricin-type beta-trefoil lectin protein
VASAQPVLRPQAVYSIRSVGSQKVVDVEAVSTADGAAVQQWGWLGGENQKWRFVPLPPPDAGFYKIVSVNSGKVLDVASAAVADGAKVIQFPWHDADNEKWQVIDAGQGTVFLQVKHSGKVLDVEGGAQNDGVKLQQWTRHGGPNQRWILRMEGGLSAGLAKVSSTVAEGAPAPGPKGALSSGAVKRQFSLPAGDIRSLMVLRAAGASAVPQSDGKVTVQQGELAAAKVAGAPVPVEPEAPATEATAPRKQWKLPYRLYGVDEQGDDLELSPMIEADAFRPNGQPGRFTAKVSLGVKNVRNLHVQAPLNPAIVMSVFAPSTVPEQIKVARTNELIPVDLEAVNPTSPVHVRIIPSFDPEGTAVDLAVTRGILTLAASPSEIQGFGLETAEVTVMSAGLPNPKGVEVTINSDIGNLGSKVLTLDDQGRASTTLRSIGTGVATMTTVETADVSAAKPFQVQFRPPWVFLASALPGGLAGALIRWGAKRESKKPGRHPAADTALRVLAGVVIAAAYAIGINLLGVHPAATAGEALVFVVAALGSYWGLRFPGLKQADPEPATG